MKFGVVRIKNHIRFKLFYKSYDLFVIKLQPVKVFRIACDLPVHSPVVMPGVHLGTHKLHVEILVMTVLSVDHLKILKIIRLVTFIHTLYELLAYIPDIVQFYFRLKLFELIICMFVVIRLAVAALA